MQAAFIFWSAIYLFLKLDLFAIGCFTRLNSGTFLYSTYLINLLASLSFIISTIFKLFYEFISLFSPINI